MQKTLIIDIGSNSVRSMLTADGKTLYKEVFTTRLGEGMYKTGLLSKESMMRTADAVIGCVGKGRSEGVDDVLIFATAAVRNSLNGDEFTAYVYRKTGIKVDVLSGDKEAEAGIVGALCGGDGCVVDEGGASTETVIAKDGKIVYSYSLPVGAVIIKDLFGEDRNEITKFAEEQVKKYGQAGKNEVLTIIGGTATAIGAIANGLEVYDREVVHGTQITVEQLENIADLLFSMSPKERIDRLHVHEKRAEIIAGGTQFLLCVAKYLGAKTLIVSESDNTEGYFLMKKKGIGYEKI